MNTKQKPFKIDKRTFKICEAVRLGLDYYYMGPKDRRPLTAKDIEKARSMLTVLPDGWWLERHDWDATRN